MRRLSAKLLWILLAFWLGLWTGPTAMAQNWGIGVSCHASVATQAEVDRLLAGEAGWACDSLQPAVSAPQTLVRWNLTGDFAPRHMIARLGHFERLTLTVIDAGGNRTSRSYASDETQPTSIGPYFRADLPDSPGEPVAVVAHFTLLGHRATAATARLTEIDPSTTPARQRALLVLAALCGMMIMPLAFNAALARVLREDFVVWHTVMVTGFAALLFIRSGLVNVYVPLSTDSWRITMIMILGCALAGAGMFTRTFIEPDRLDPLSKRLLPPVSLWIILATCIHAADFAVLRPLGGDFHALAMLPALLLYVYTLGRALRNGSRAAIFQAVGWTPLVIAFSVQVVTQLTTALQPADVLPLFYGGILFEALVTAVGVADRFMAIKQERDSALADAKSLEYLADRDPLTGLMNRRAVEMRFAGLRQQGFDTVALLDLDRFKEINDKFGHRCGDAVLVACASALSATGGRDSIAIRMGGEEFLVLLRGKETLRHAEALRQKIPQIVAEQVEGLDRLVTASMGVIEIPRRGLDGMTFSELYERADTLLYEAKESGRNRAVHERLVMFEAPRRKRARVA